MDIVFFLDFPIIQSYESILEESWPEKCWFFGFIKVISNDGLSTNDGNWTSENGELDVSKHAAYLLWTFF